MPTQKAVEAKAMAAAMTPKASWEAPDSVGVGGTGLGGFGGSGKFSWKSVQPRRFLTISFSSWESHRSAHMAILCSGTSIRATASAMSLLALTFIPVK